MNEEVRRVLEAAAVVCGIDDVTSRCRYVRYVRARRIVCVYLVRHLHFVQRDVADIIKRDRSTVAEFVAGHEAMMRSDIAYHKAWNHFANLTATGTIMKQV